MRGGEGGVGSLIFCPGHAESGSIMAQAARILNRNSDFEFGARRLLRDGERPVCILTWPWSVHPP